MLFARYAFPPNQHGYCGPADAAGFFASGLSEDDSELRVKARDFDGAVPYLQLIAHSCSGADVLDPEVVEAYWLGSPLLDEVGGGGSVPSGPLFSTLESAWTAGAVAHHSFVVFAVYPWVSMLGDERRTPQALKVLDGCRIRWGRVLDVFGDQLSAESQPLSWDGQRLGYGPSRVETVRLGIDGRGLTSTVAVGDRVALHWDWVCDRISEDQQTQLEHYSQRSLTVVNHALARRRTGSTSEVVAG